MYLFILKAYSGSEHCLFWRNEALMMKCRELPCFHNVAHRRRERNVSESTVGYRR